MRDLHAPLPGALTELLANEGDPKISILCNITPPSQTTLSRQINQFAFLNSRSGHVLPSLEWDNQGC
jgi:hypothetical protein